MPVKRKLEEEEEIECKRIKSRNPCASCYREPQFQEYCQVHALNAILGEEAVSCPNMMQFAKQWVNENPSRQKIQQLNHSFYTDKGFFSLDVTNAWLKKFKGKHLVPAGKILQSAPKKDKQNALKEGGSSSYFVTSRGHAIALRSLKSKDDKIWCYVDSLFFTEPIPLGSKGYPWKELQGNLWKLKKYQEPIKTSLVIELDGKKKRY